MSNILARFATSEPTACAVCRRHAVCLGYAPRQGQPVIWLCDNADCHSGARGLYKMPQQQLDAYEIGAVLAGGEAGGQFLDEIGITDLSMLDGDNWREFLRRVLTTYETTLRQRILDHAAPF